MKKYFLLLILPLIVLSGCKREGCTDPNAVNYDEKAKKDCCCEYPGNLTLSLNAKYGSEDFTLGQTYQHNGRAVELTNVRFYLSQIRLLQGNQEFLVPDSYIFFDGVDDTYQLKSIAEAGDFTGIRFYIGVDSVTNNTKLPTAFSATPDHPLYNFDMHWGWATGYIFTKIEGMVDSTSTPDGTVEKPIGYHLGTDPLLREKTIQYNFSIANNQTTALNIDVDVSRFFDGLDMPVENTTHTMNNMPLAVKVANNAPNAFSKGP